MSLNKTARRLSSMSAHLAGCNSATGRLLYLDGVIHFHEDHSSVHDSHVV